MARYVLSAALVLWVACDAVFAQTIAAGDWLRPYPAAPQLWELVGRLFPDTPEARRDRRFRGFLDPSVLAAGTIKDKAKPGEILGTFVRYLPVQDNNVLNTVEPPDRLNVAQVFQVLFVGIDNGMVRLEFRDGDPSSEFQRCYDGRHTTFAHLPDIRVQSAVLCEGALFWTAWRGQPLVGLDTERSGSIVLDQFGTLVFTLDPATSQITASIRTPEVGAGAGPRVR